MKRREFITLLGGAAAWPVEARAQQADRMRRIGVLMHVTESDPDGQARLTAFAESLKELGWAEGSNLRLDVRWGPNDPDRYPRQAAELVAMAPDALVAPTSFTLAPLQRATRSVPASSPVWLGPAATLRDLSRLSTRLARSGSNCSKRLRLMSPGRQFYAIPRLPRELANLLQSRQLELLGSI